MTSLASSLLLAVVATIVAARATVQPIETIGPNDPAAFAAIRAAYMKPRRSPAASHRAPDG